MHTMPTRRFGRTELAMPVLTCGGMRHQHGWKDMPLKDIPADVHENFRATTLRAYEAGITHFETARGYGPSEVQFGDVLPELPREKIIVQTKVGPEEDPNRFREVLEASLRSLKLDYIDLFAFHGVHNPELLAQTVRKGGCLEVVREYQRDGRIRFVGFSTHGAAVHTVENIATGEFDFVNLHWYFVNDPVTWPGVAAAAAADMGVFIISVNDKGGRLYDPPPKLASLCQPLSPMIWNQLYCLAREDVHTLSLGPARPEEVDAHLALLDHYDQRRHWADTIAEKVRGAMVEVLGEGWFRGWMDGLPEWWEVPGEIHVKEILRLWNLARGLDMVAYARGRYNLLGTAGPWVPGRNAAELGQLDVRDCLKDSPFAERIPGILAEAHDLLYEAPAKRESEAGKEGD
jgi:predicted aldo/keto reductase-like oxidoreductase